MRLILILLLQSVFAAPSESQSSPRSSLKSKASGLTRNKTPTISFGEVVVREVSDSDPNYKKDSPSHQLPSKIEGIKPNNFLLQPEPQAPSTPPKRRKLKPYIPRPTEPIPPLAPTVPKIAKVAVIVKMIEHEPRKPFKISYKPIQKAEDFKRLLEILHTPFCKSEESPMKMPEPLKIRRVMRIFLQEVRGKDAAPTEEKPLS